MPRFRKLKPELQKLLIAPDWEEQLGGIDDIEPKTAIGPLMSFLLYDGELKWRSITALGLVIARLAEQSLEDARVIMRRLMWYLNEESGNLGWGAPETMGEAMANHPKLAKEYHKILASYVIDLGSHGNYLDHDLLRRGAYWGLGRLAQAYPELAAHAAPTLLHDMTAQCAMDEQSPQSSATAASGPCLMDRVALGYSAWTLGLLRAVDAKAPLKALLADESRIELYDSRRLREVTVAELAGQALARIQEGEAENKKKV